MLASVLHLKLWMLAFDPGTSIAITGILTFIKGGILQMVSEHCVACRIMTLGLETTKENFQLLLHLSILLVNFSNLLSHLYL